MFDVGQQGPEAEAFPMFGSCGVSQLPSSAPVTGNRSKTVPGRQAEMRREGVWGRGVPRFREETELCYFSCFAGFKYWIFDLSIVAYFFFQKGYQYFCMNQSTTLTPVSFVWS